MGIVASRLVSLQSCVGWCFSMAVELVIEFRAENLGVMRSFNPKP